MHLNRDNNRFDVLRLFAAWLVLFSHCYPLTGRPAQEPLFSALGIDTLGGVGVTIFFVLSGYLVALSLERSSPLTFVRRRLLRIYPALISICLLCVLVLGPLLTTLPQMLYWRDNGTLAYLRTASAWWIRYPLPGVFTDNPLPSAINGSLWSLPYEISCYLVLLLLGQLPGSLRVKVALAAAGLAALLLARPQPSVLNPFAPFVGLDFFHTKLGLIFALGALLACWRIELRPWLAPALLLLMLALFYGHGAWQLLGYLLGLSSVILWLALYGSWLPRIPSRIGDWSYGMYLYGFPVQQLLAHFKLHELSFSTYVAASTLMTLALAGLSWHLVEKRALRLK